MSDEHPPLEPPPGEASDDQPERPRPFPTEGEGKGLAGGDQSGADEGTGPQRPRPGR